MSPPPPFAALTGIVECVGTVFFLLLLSCFGGRVGAACGGRGGAVVATVGILIWILHTIDFVRTISARNSVLAVKKTLIIWL